MIVYRTTNKINGKCYVGQDSKDILKYLGSGLLLNKAIEKYGRENFEKEIMAWCYTKEHLNFLEKFYIVFLNTKVPNGYNLTDGGVGGVTPNHKGHISWNKGLTKETDERVARQSEIMKGKHFSEEHKKKIGDTSRGRFVSEETRKKLGLVWKDRHHSEETKRKMSEAAKGKPKSEDHKRKLSEIRKGKPAWNKGLTWSEERKRKISESCKRENRVGR